MFTVGQTVAWATRQGRAFMGTVLSSSERQTEVRVTSGSHTQKHNGQIHLIANKFLADMSSGRGIAQYRLQSF